MKKPTAEGVMSWATLGAVLIAILAAIWSTFTVSRKESTIVTERDDQAFERCKSSGGRLFTKVGTGVFWCAWSGGPDGEQ